MNSHTKILLDIAAESNRVGYQITMAKLLCGMMKAHPRTAVALYKQNFVLGYKDITCNKKEITDRYAERFGVGQGEASSFVDMVLGNQEANG